MDDFSERLFGQIAVRLGYLTPAQAEAVLREQATAGADAPPLNLLLVERRLLTAEQAGRVLRRQHELFGATPDPTGLAAESSVCALTARTRGLATDDAVSQALSVQANEIAAGKGRRLVQILFESGAMTLDAVLEVLAAQAGTELTCRACGRRFIAITPSAGDNPRCPQCRTARPPSQARPEVAPAAAAAAPPPPPPHMAMRTPTPLPTSPRGEDALAATAAGAGPVLAGAPLNIAVTAATPAAAPPPPAAGPADSAVRRADDRFFGQFAVRSAYLTEEQVQDLVQQQAEVGRAGVQLGIADLCQLRQILTYRQVQHVLEVQRLFQVREEDRLLGMIVEKRQIATNAQVQSALAEQREAYRASHKLPRLAEVLAARAGLTPVQIAALREIEAQVRVHLANSSAAGPAPKAEVPASPAPAARPSVAPPPPLPAEERTGSLIVESGPDAGRTFPLGSRTTVGRVAPSQVLLSDKNTSRQHVRIEYSATTRQHVLHDLESFNGSYVNGEAVRVPRVLQAGDRIRIGATVMRFTAADLAAVADGDDALGATQPLTSPLSAAPARTPLPGAAPVPAAPPTPPPGAAQAAAFDSFTPADDDGTLPEYSTPPLPLPALAPAAPAGAARAGGEDRAAGPSARRRQLLRAIGEAALRAGIQGAEAMIARQATQRLNALKGMAAPAGVGSHWVDGGDGSGPSWHDQSSADLGTAVSALAEALERLGRYVVDHNLRIPGQEERMAQLQALEAVVAPPPGSRPNWPWIAAAAALGIAAGVIAAIYFGPETIRLTDSIVIQRGPRDVFLARVLWGAGAIALLHLAYFAVLIVARLRSRSQRRLRLS